MEPDWRLEKLEGSDLKGAQLEWKTYRAPRPDWDHDHCAGCWAKFAEYADPQESILHEGYATGPEHPGRAEYEWICPECFDDLAEAMEWTSNR